MVRAVGSGKTSGTKLIGRTGIGLVALLEGGMSPCPGVRLPGMGSDTGPCGSEERKEKLLSGITLVM